MKFSFLPIAAAAAFVFGLTSVSQATIWTVSNDANRPAQFTNLNDAHDAASSGDTILVTGSSTYYPNLDVYKPLTIIGEGIAGGPTARMSSLTFKRLNNALSSSGSRVYGMEFDYLNIYPYFSGSAAGEEVLEDYIIERCRISGLTFQANSGDHIENVTIRNSKIDSYLTAYGTSGICNSSNVIISNNVFSDAYLSIQGETNNTWLIQNNLFLNRTSSVFSSDPSELVIENNIFYKAEPTGAVNSIFNNNLTFLCNNGTLPYGSNVGSGNIINENPLFANYPELGGVNHSFDHDYSLLAGSPAEGTGTNSTDIGLGGGNAPVANIPMYPAIPAVTVLDIPVSSVPVGGTLQVNIEAISRN